MGPFAPVAYIGAEIGQILVIPIPGQPFEITGGWLFGLVPGALLGSVGAIAGSFLAFLLGRHYGQPWLEKRIAEETREKFFGRFGREGRAEWIVFWLMLVPAFPRDPLCYLAGLTGLSPGRFAVIAAIGRPVGLVPWVALGAEGVALGLELQLVLAAAVGAVWLLHAGYARFLRGDSAQQELVDTSSPEGEMHA